MPTMTGEVASLDVLLLLAWAILLPATLILGIWAIVDAATRPGRAFELAGSSKPLWITLVAVSLFVCWPIGIVLSLVYLVKIRTSVKEAQATLALSGATPLGPYAVGWHRDPSNTAIEWYWDGTRYTSSRQAAPPAAPPPPS